MTTPLLEGYRRCHSSDPERMQAYLDTVGFRVEALRDDDAPLDMRVNGVYLPGMYIGYTQYGKAATIRAAPERTDYWFSVAGAWEARSAGPQGPRRLRHGARGAERPEPDRAAGTLGDGMWPSQRHLDGVRRPASARRSTRYAAVSLTGFRAGDRCRSGVRAKFCRIPASGD